MVVMCSSLVPRLAGMFHELMSRDRQASGSTPSPLPARRVRDYAPKVDPPARREIPPNRRSQSRQGVNL